MEHHLELSARLVTKKKYEGLYSWCLQEIDGNGEVVGRDLIPWSLGLQFEASELKLITTAEVSEFFHKPQEGGQSARMRRYIRAELKSEKDTSGRLLNRSTSYSMIGTERRDVTFELVVEAISAANPVECCHAWGAVAYTHELDFRATTEPDRVMFNLFVSPAEFEKYAKQIENDAVTHATLSVGHVSGFYSDWSPSISTDLIKILTAYKEQEVICPAESDIIPPRLGTVGEAVFTIWKSLKIESPELSAPETGDLIAQPMLRQELIQPRHNVERLLTSIQIGIWLNVLLLTALVFK